MIEKIQPKGGISELTSDITPKQKDIRTRVQMYQSYTKSWRKPNF